MDKHFVDVNGHHFVAIGVDAGYERDDGAVAIQAPPSPDHRWVNGQWVVPIPKPLTKPERKESLKARVRTHGLVIRRGGFEVNFGTDEQPRIEVLQLREATPDNDDEKNWMASLSAYTAAVIGGAGDLPGAKFRPESNATITVSYAQGMAILTGLFDWVASLVAEVWQKCDQIDGADTHAELDTLEAQIEQGWPA